MRQSRSGIFPIGISGSFVTGAEQLRLLVRACEPFLTSAFQAASAPLPSMASTSSPLCRFLVIDENSDGRFLLSKTLLRAFPNALVVECRSADTAFHVLQTEEVAAIL